MATHAQILTAETPTQTCDLLTLSAGAIEGGVEQIIAVILPAALETPGLRAWSFERGAAPAAVVQLLVDADPASVAELLETCEDRIATDLHDEPRLVARPLVELPRAPATGEVAWGVGHRRIALPGSAEDHARFWPVEQASSALAVALVAGVSENGWDLKTLGPALFDRTMTAIAGATGAAPRAHAIMQALLAAHPRADALTRQFRENAHRLVAGGHVPMDGPVDAPLAAVADEIAALAAAVVALGAAQEPAALAEIWRRLAGRIGFSQIEAAYLAGLASTARGVK